jgi:hypothetical protein
MKTKLLIAAIIAGVFLGLTLSAIPFKNYYFEKGLEEFNQGENAVNEGVFKNSLTEAIRSFEISFLFNKFSLFDHTYLSETQYKMGMSHLYLRQHKLAHAYFKAAKRNFSLKDDYIDKQELDSKIIQSLVRVEGTLGQGRALVNQNIVRAGDLVGDVKVVEVTEHYVVFEKGQETFSDSIDKYNPLAKKARRKCWRYFDAAREADNLRFMRDYYWLGKKQSEVFLQTFSMDWEQTEEVKEAVAEADRQIADIDREIAQAINQGVVVAGMTGQQAEKILGPPLETNRMVGKEADERWIYEDTILYFKMDLISGDKRVLVDWQEK